MGEEHELPKTKKACDSGLKEPIHIFLHVSTKKPKPRVLHDLCLLTSPSSSFKETMKVTVDVQGGLLFLLEVNPSMTVRKLKQVMRTSKGAEMAKQTFWFNETLLQDNLTLESYGIQDGAWLNLNYDRDCTGQPITILARFGNWEFPLEVRDTMTVGQFKEMFQEHTRIPMETMKVSHKTEVMGSNAFLYHYFITEGSVIRVQFKNSNELLEEEE